MNIILMDDEPLALNQLKDAVCEALPDETPMCFSTAEDALQYAEETPVDVAFLDIETKSMSGLELAEKLTEIKPDTNIIFVTGYTTYYDDAFELYASGYVKKPARAKRIQREIKHLRHPVGAKQDEVVRQLGPYTFDHTAHRVYYNGRDTLLAPREYRLFCLFAGNPGVCFSPEDIFQKLWGDDPNGSAENTVRVHISSLRKKLAMQENGTPVIKKRRGEGYYLDLMP